LLASRPLSCGAFVWRRSLSLLALDGVRTRRSRHQPRLINVYPLSIQRPRYIEAIENTHWHFHRLPSLVGISREGCDIDSFFIASSRRRIGSRSRSQPPMRSSGAPHQRSANFGLRPATFGHAPIFSVARWIRAIHISARRPELLKPRALGHLVLLERLCSLVSVPAILAHRPAVIGEIADALPEVRL